MTLGKTTLLIVFFVSGFASLTYQVVWQRALTLHYGVGNLSTTLIVSVYMLGLGLGSLLGGVVADRRGNNVLYYCLIELGLAVFGAASLPFLAYLGEATAGSPYALSFLYMFLFLFIPTFLMGATLPLLVRVFTSTVPDFLENVSLLYFSNTLGAAVGALVTSYVLISFFGLDGAVYSAVALNLLIAAVLFLAMRSHSSAEPSPGGIRAEPGGFGLAAYPLVFVSGFLAIGYEIVWFRLTGVLVKASPYAFSTTLFVYLLGIAVGSYAMNRYVDARPRADFKNLFLLVQFWIGASVLIIVLAFYYGTLYTPFSEITRLSYSRTLHPGALNELSISAVFGIVDVFFWPVLFCFVPTLLMGASFPLVTFLALTDEDAEGRTVGRTYFFNTLGNLAGGVVTGLVLLSLWGSERTLLLFVVVGLGFGLFTKQARHLYRERARGAAVALVVAALLLAFPRGDGHQLYAALHPVQEGERLIDEGLNGVVVTYQNQDNVIAVIQGMAHGGRPNPAFYYEAFEALRFAREPRRALVIGYGTGSIVEALLKSEELEELTLVELNSVLIHNLRRLPLFREMLADERVKLIIDDGRRFLHRTDEKFDIIMIDPLRSTTAYSNNLYSKEFFELVQNHLDDGGVFSVWMDEFRAMPATVASVFSRIRMYNFFCLASEDDWEPAPARADAVLARFTPATQTALKGLDGTYLGDESYVLQKTAGYPINRDFRPHAEYYLGLALRTRWRQRE